MASSDNLTSIEPWAFHSRFADSWLTEMIARDTDTLTRALQMSLAAANSENLISDSVSPFLNLGGLDTILTPTVSGLSGSDQETAPKRQRSVIPPATGKVSKRKSRGSKRSQTTFITANPANFRQMVQQVTGVRFSNSQLPMAPILKPEPQRLGSRLPMAGAGCLPTLDTSAFLLDHQQHVVAPTSDADGGTETPVLDPRPFAPRAGVADAMAGLGSGRGLDFDTFSCFPTLESWKVM